MRVSHAFVTYLLVGGLFCEICMGCDCDYHSASWSMQFLDPEVEPGCVGNLRRLSTGLPGPNFDLGPHFSALILSLSTFSFSMHFFAFSDTEI